MRKEKKNVSMLYIANWFEFGFIIMIAISMFFKSTLAGVLMLICAAFCSPFMSKKPLKSGKFSKSSLFISHTLLFLILWIVSVAISTPKVETAPEPTQQIIAEETTAEATEQPTEPATETEPETIPETTETVTEAATEPKSKIDVKIDYKCEKLDNNETVITVYTNLPDETVLMLTVSGEDGIAQDKVTIKQGIGISNGFSNHGEPLEGDLKLDVSMSMASLQSKSVQSVIGEEGEFLIGEYVEESSFGGKIVSASFDLDLSKETFTEELISETESNIEIETAIPETELETEPPTEPKKQVGKDIDTIDTFHYNGAVRNDVTGDWKCAVFAESGINVAEYAVSYYDKYMSGSDTEIDAVINLSDKTTTKIVQAIAPEKLALTVYQYVQGEEHDAKLMFSGQVLAYYMVNKETGEITEE